MVSAAAEEWLAADDVVWLWRRVETGFSRSLGEHAAEEGLKVRRPWSVMHAFQKAVVSAILCSVLMVPFRLLGLALDRREEVLRKPRHHATLMNPGSDLDGPLWNGACAQGKEVRVRELKLEALPESHWTDVAG